MKVTFSWWTPGEERVLELEIDASAPNFLDAVTAQLENNGLSASRVALWSSWPPDAELAAFLTFEGINRVDGPVFIRRDVSAAEVAAFSDAYGEAHRLWLRPNEGVGGDEIWSFIATSHATLQTIFEFAAYFQVVRYLWLTPHKATAKEIQNEFRIAVVCGGISDELRGFLRARETWTSRELEERFGLTIESVGTVLARCGFSPRGDRVGQDVVWFRDLDTKGDDE
ncbi:hypothetical protein [Agromyces sp. NPDC056965]|uniref:hypothetical protein n=1 Tax=Agromyces sp. NPDC056965 TaxID=3345983 RepID=UPI003625DA61